MISSGCSTGPDVVVKPEIVPALPPLALLRPCPNPFRLIDTTGQLVEQLTATRGALKACAAQVDALAQWRAEAEKILAE